MPSTNSGAVGPRRRLLSNQTLRWLLWSVRWLLLGAALTALVYQIPAAHRVEVGRNDGSYVQGFADAMNRWGVLTDNTGVARPYRWSGPASAIIFPQIGLPARATLRWRAWRPRGSQPVQVRVLLNGRDELGSFAASGDWEEHSFELRSGLAKPRDVFFQLVVAPPLMLDGLPRGVQVDRATLATSAWPIIPYPSQLLGGALATLLAAVVFLQRPRFQLAAAAGMSLLFLLCYRLQLTPYPIRLFWPALIVVLGWALAAQTLERIRFHVPPRLSQRERGLRGESPAADWTTAKHVLIDRAAVALVAVWSLALWSASRAHVVLSVPGVEKDFRVFATRSNTLLCSAGPAPSEAGCVLRADGFYQLGYPFLLWLVRPFTGDNAFLAARLVGIAGAAAFLLATYLLGCALLGRGPALLALLLVVLNRWTAEYALYLGTDMPFAAAWAGALAMFLLAGRGRRRVLVAGALCGLAFLIRHPGILLLPLGGAWLLWQGRLDGGWRKLRAYRWQPLGWLLAGFLIVSAPQLVVNTLGTGNPFYSQQAKNIWLAVYGNTDWGHWGEAANDLALRDVIAHDPDRFLANWWGNLRAFWGTGSEDPSEFGRALALRLLSFPANLLALAGLLLWLVRGGPRRRFLLLGAALYVAALAVGFLLPRFVLPLIPIWALAAASAAAAIWSSAAAQAPGAIRTRRALLGAAAVVLLLIAGSPPAGLRGVLDNQDRDAAAAVALIERMLLQGERFVAYLPPDDTLAKYSAIAHLATAQDDPAARYVLRSDNQSGTVVGRAGRYTLLKLNR